jgi:assimilatory nitrate reductase catalytic subunit
MVRGRGGAWEKAGWEEALDTVAGRLQAIKAAGGGHALFGLASEDCSNEELLLFREVVSKAFAGSHLGTLDGGHLSTVSQAWGDLAGTFLGLKEAPWTRLPEADLLLLVGVQSGDTQPLVLSLVRRAALEHRVPVEVLGGADVMQPWTRHFVAAKPSDLACLIRALLGRVIGSGQMGNPLVRWRKIADEVGQEPVADFPGSAALEPKSVEAFHAMAAALAQARAPMIVAGTAVSGLRDPEGLKCLMYLALLKGLLPADTLRLVILKPRGNSAGAAKLGYAANGDGPSAVGWRGGIVLLGGREEVPPDVLKPMERLEFLAVIAPQIPAGLADRAHVLIPKPLWLEDEGSYTSLDGREVGRTRRVLSPPAGVKGAWETLAALAARAGLRPDVWTLEGLRDRTAAEMNLMG